MKRKVPFFAIMLMALAMPFAARAYTFSAVAPSGQTLYYQKLGNEMMVVPQNSSYPYYTTYPTGNLVIPSSVVYNGVQYPVTSIEDDAFSHCASLTSVTIPNGVTSIGSSAFAHCTSLTSVTIPNSVTSIERSTFFSCTSLTTVTIPNSVTSIGNQAFQSCTNLTSVTIPNGVTLLGESAFYQCTRLTSVTIPNSVTSIEYWVFRGCSSLTSVTIPNTVSSIKGAAFYQCTSLTSVTIPNSVTYIESSAFEKCYNLTDVTVEWTESNLIPSGNGGLAATNRTLHVPCNRIGMYSEKWAGFGSYVQPDSCDKTITLQPGDEAMGTVHGGGIFPMDTAITVSATPYAGYHFTAWSDGSTENPRTITVAGDATYTALFEINSYHFATNAYTTAGTSLTHGSVVQLFALPQVNLRFTGWSNGVTANPYALSIDSDTIVNALYEPVRKDTVVITTHDTIRLYTHDTVINLMHDTTEYNHYFYDTLVVFDTTRVFDTLVVTHYDTTHFAQTFYDTTRVYDTLVLVNVDTLHHYYYDTTVVSVTVYDTAHFVHTLYDTTRVYDTLVLISVDMQHHYFYDTTVVHNTIFDTTRVYGKSDAH